MANRAPTPPAPPTADAAAGSYESEDHGALVAESYLPDGTFVQRFEDGTEFHYPPENPADTANYYASAYQQDPNAGTAGNNVAPVGTNPMMEFYGYGAHYQQNAAAVSTPMANANLGPAPPLGVDNAGAVDSQHSKKDRKKHRDDEAEANAAADDAAAEPGISADEDVKADELPTSGFWLVDCFSEAFFSLAFKLWACQIFFNVFMIFFFVGLDFLFATQYRLIAPPTDMQGTLFWQTMAFGCIFTVLSFFIVTLLRMLIDVMREIFQAKRTDNYLFGVQLSSSHPPYAIHVFLVVVLTVVPVMWTIILTVTKGRTFAYLIQFFLFAATILGIFTSFIIFIVMWVNSFMMKRFAYNQREEEKRVSRDYQKKYHHKKPSSSDESESESSSDDTEEGNDEDKAKRRKKRHQRRRRRRATHTTTISATGRTMAAAWYDSELTLQEFGLNNKTVRWMIPVFLFGWMPVQVVTVVFVFDSVAPSWEVSWLVVGFVIIISFIALAEGNTRFTPRVGTFVNLVVLIGFMCFGVLCTAISGNTTLVGIFIVLLLVTQGLMLRKRPYEMLPHEIEAAFGPAVDQVGANQPVDTYLCLCRNTLLEFMRCGDCCDVYGTFGKKNPKVRAVEKQYRKENLTLMTDMRLLMYYWIILWIGMAGASSFASELSPWYTGRTFAVGPGAYPSVPPTPENPLADSYGRTSKLCSLNFNAASYNATQLANLSHYNSSNPTVPFNMTAVDLALLGSVASAVGGGAITSYNIWFSISTPQLNIFNPPGGSQTDQTGRYGYQWFDVYDTMTKLRVVYVNSMPRGVGWMRTIDLYGGVLALDMAGAFAPFINVWPEDVKTDWVSGVNFLKSWYKGDVKNDFSILESHVQNQTAYGENVLLAGHGVDGAIARMVAMRNGLPSFTFNTPGTRWIRGKFDVDYASRPDMHHTIVTDCDSWQQLDRLGGDTTVYTVYSARDQHGQFDPSCSAPHSLAKTLINLCGDPLSRNILNLFN